MMMTLMGGWVKWFDVKNIFPKHRFFMKNFSAFFSVFRYNTTITKYKNQESKIVTIKSLYKLELKIRS